MNLLKKNIFYILFFIIGVILASGGIKLYTFGVDYEEKTIRNITLVDTSSTTYKHKRNTFFNTNGFFVDDLTGQRFRHAIQDKVYPDTPHS